MVHYENISEVKIYIKHLFKEIVDLEVQKEDHQEQLFDRILYLMELYISNEVELYIEKMMPSIVEKIINEIKNNE